MRDFLVLLVKATPAYCRWLGSALLVYLATVLAVLLSPVVCLFARKNDQGDYDLPKGFRWMTTHDAAMQVHWYNGHPKQRRWFHKYPIERFETSFWLRYVVFVDWILTNPAYRVKHALGFDQRGMQLLYVRDEGKYWDSGYNNLSFWITKNRKGQYGFMLQWQWYYYKNWCVEFYLGWKLFRTDDDRICMIATRLSPIRTYKVRTEQEIQEDWAYTQSSREKALEHWAGD